MVPIIPFKISSPTTFEATLHLVQENLGCLGWELSDKHYQTLSTLSYQAKYFSGKGMAYNEKGPYYTFEDLWNEVKPAADP